MEKNGEGVRKGAWTKDEDDLLKNCVEMYGEGKWHLVPPRTGLNRCRKSCRLRWMNYLRPNLKRGCFMEDEVDLIQRLHKLLGNRWSLIAGRLPGRTANDVKNFWNTHIANKSVVSTESCRRKTTQETIRRSNIIKPRPRTLTVSQRPMCPSDQVTKTNEQNDEYDHENPNKKQASSSVSLSQEEPNYWKNGSSEFCSNNEQLVPSPSLLQEEVDKCIHWWSSLLEVNENGNEITPLPFSDNDLFGFGNNGFDLDGFTSSLSVDADVCKHVSYQQFQ